MIEIYLKNSSRSIKILLLIVIVVTGYFTANFFFYSAESASYPYDLIPDEGNLVISSYNLIEGDLSQLYNKLSQKPVFFFNDYPPLFYAATSLTALIWGKSLFAGRMVSFVFCVLSGIIIYLLGYKRTEDRLLSLAASLLFFSSEIIFYWGGVFRPDMLALFFSLSGLYLILDYENDARFYASILCFLAAAFTKQTFIIGFFASTAYLYFKSRKKSKIFFLIYTVAGSVLFLLLNLLTDFSFLNHILINMRLNLTLKYFIISFFSFYFLPLAISLHYAVRNKKDLLSLYLLFGLGFVLFYSLKFGGWKQYLIPLVFITSLLPFLQLKQELEDKSIISGSLVLLAIVFHLVGLSLNYPVLGGALVNNSLSPYHNLKTDQQIASYVQEEENILIENRGFLVRNNKSLTPEIWGLVEAVKSGEVKNRELYHFFRKRNISLIAYHHQGLSHNLKPLDKYITNFCQLKSKLEFKRRNFIVTHWFTYSCQDNKLWG